MQYSFLHYRRKLTTKDDKKFDALWRATANRMKMFRIFLNELPEEQQEQRKRLKF